MGIQNWSENTLLVNLVDEPQMSEELETAVRNALKPDVSAFRVFRLDPPKKGTSAKTKAYICNCEKATVRVAEKVDLQATCNICGEDYRLKDPEIGV